MGKIIMLEEGLNILEEGIEKAKMILDGYQPNALFGPAEYIKYYDCIYYMCAQHPPYNYSVQLIERFKRALVESISSRVLPSLLDTDDDDSLIVQLANMWERYKKMAQCLGGFFHYLDRNNNSISLSDISVRCFHDLVFVEHYKKSQGLAISMIRKQRDEKTIDRDFLHTVSTIFVEIGHGNSFYYDNFEKALLAETANYYSQLASEWLNCYSSAAYFHKVEVCLKEEEARATQYLYPNSVEKLIQVVQWHLVGQIATTLTEKQKAESCYGSAAIQELLGRCANLNLEDKSSSM